MKLVIAIVGVLALSVAAEAAPLRTTTLRVAVRSTDVRTSGTCVSQPSSQLTGTRVQCFGGAGSRAVIVKVINTATYGILPSKVSAPKVYGRGAFETVTATLKGRIITVRVVVARRDALDISQVGVLVAYTRE